MFYLVWLFVKSSSLLYAQDVPFKKKLFKNKKEAFKQARKHFLVADEIIETERDYDKALKYYLRAYKVNPNNIELNNKIATCFLNGSKTNKTSAKPYLYKAKRLGSKSQNENLFSLGKVYQYEAKWDSAIDFYNQYLTSENITQNLQKAAVLYLQNCANALKLAQDTTRVFIDNLGRGLNTAYPDYGAVFNRDFSRMYFTSRKYNTTGYDIDLDFHYYEDIYESTFKNGRWSRVRNMKFPINSSGHEAVLGLSSNGKKMLIYRGDNNGDIYLAYRQGKKWSTPEKLPKPINTRYQENSACFSTDGKKIYFASNRKGTLGGLDIFVSEYLGENKWSEPINLGSKINTEYDETSPFIHPNGKMLFFSSNGSASIGGYDVFESKLVADNWETPKNIGFPINTLEDDLYFFSDSLGKFAYYTSKQEESKGASDIYKVTFLGPEKPLQFISAKRYDSIPDLSLAAILDELIFENISDTSLELVGKVVGKDGNGLHATIILEDVLQQTIIYKDTTDISGNFETNISQGTAYRLNISANGFLFYSEEIEFENNEIAEKRIQLIPIKKGEKLVLQDIYFASGSAELSVDSQPALEKILAFLKQNPDVKIGLIGHTDNVGSAEINLILSKARAKAVFDWLVKQKVSLKRLRYTGKGATTPVGDNNTEVGRKKNRRTELEIIAITH
ncbi:MAG: OmpA family protein [Bacteroidota bacterium]